MSVIACLVVACVVAVAAFWRLSQGPVSLSFLRDNVRSTISDGLGGLPVEVADVILERDSVSGRTSVRLRDLRLFDSTGRLIAKAPRAAIEVKGSELMTGNVVPVGLELIGPNIKIRRLITGGVKLGFGDVAQGLPAAVDSETTKGDSLRAEPQAPSVADEVAADVVATEGLIEYLRSEFVADTSVSAAATIRSISVSRAVVSLYDEENDAIWNAPDVNLAFKKVPYGASLFVDALVGGNEDTMRMDMVANFKRETGDYSLTARFHDLVPANLSRKIFILSDLAKVSLPLSGRLDLEVARDGNLKSANAELSAGAGQVNFPDFLSQPLQVKEGLVRLKWDPASKSVAISDSSLLVSGAQASLSGRIKPQWSKNGRIETVRFELKSRDTPINGLSGARSAGFIERIDASGTASMAQGRVDLEDLLIMTGNSGVRMRGVFAEGGETMSIALSGRVQNLPVGMLLSLWSPIVAPQTRVWVGENIPKGRLTDGSFLINLPSEVLAPALRDKTPLPDGSVKVDVNFADVTSNYYKGQPPFENLSGKILIDGDTMALASLRGIVRARKDRVVQVESGRMDITKLADPVSQGDFKVKLRGALGTFLDLADREPLRFVSESGLDPKGARSNVAMSLRVQLPLMSNRPKGSTKVSADVELAGLTIPDAARGMPLTDGNLRLNISNDGVSGRGPVKLAGVPAKLEWARWLAPQARQQLKLETTLNDAQRRKLGIDLSKFMSGPIGFSLQGQSQGAEVTKVNVTANLSKTRMRLDAIHWRHTSSKGARATFVADFSNPKFISVSNLNLKGKDLLVKGNMKLGADGKLITAELPIVNLGPNNNMGLRISKNSNGATELDVTGKSFDARPMIAALFDETTGRLTPSGNDLVSIRAQFGSVYAYRNQHLVNVRAVASARGQALSSMQLGGMFTDRTTLDLDIAPNSDGSRSMKIKSTNAGAAFRASNLYSKVQGGKLDFKANLGKPGEGTIRRGDLEVRSFLVADEKQLQQFRRDPNTNAQSGPLAFDKLTLPFAVDREFVRIGDARVQGAAVGALAKGSIRKADGKLSIGGTLIPAYGLNSALSNLPILGLLIAGGKDEGVIGVTFGLRGTMKSPEIKINPVSALAPGFLRKMFEFNGRGALNERPPRVLGDELENDNR
ncbi:MAG: DUF3971 domain-containing protein [Pseudomonadota bacterium]